MISPTPGFGQELKLSGACATAGGPCPPGYFCPMGTGCPSPALGHLLRSVSALSQGVSSELSSPGHSFLP